MAKPFRVKRGSKYIGSWKARIKGEIVNLETQDAEEARRRERRARAGDLGWQRKVADDVKGALDGDIEPVEVDDPVSEPEISQGVASSEPAAAGPESGPIPAAAGPPSSEPAPDPVDALNETAAGMAGDVRQTLESAGIDLGELMAPETLGALHVAGQDLLFRVVAPMVTKREPKPLELPEKFAGAVKILGQAWRAQLSKWNVSLDGIAPGSLILLATAGMLAVQVMALYQKPEDAAQGAAPGVA